MKTVSDAFVFIPCLFPDSGQQYDVKLSFLGSLTGKVRSRNDIDSYNLDSYACRKCFTDAVVYSKSYGVDSYINGSGGITFSYPLGGLFIDTDSVPSDYTNKWSDAGLSAKLAFTSIAASGEVTIMSLGNMNSASDKCYIDVKAVVDAVNQTITSFRIINVNDSLNETHDVYVTAPQIEYSIQNTFSIGVYRAETEFGAYANVSFFINDQEVYSSGWQGGAPGVGDHNNGVLYPVVTIGNYYGLSTTVECDVTVKDIVLLVRDSFYSVNDVRTSNYLVPIYGSVFNEDRSPSEYAMIYALDERYDILGVHKALVDGSYAALVCADAISYLAVHNALGDKSALVKITP